VVRNRGGETELFALQEHRAIRVEIRQHGGMERLEWPAELNHVGAMELFVWRGRLAINVVMKQGLIWEQDAAEANGEMARLVPLEPRAIFVKIQQLIGLENCLLHVGVNLVGEEAQRA